MKMNGQSVGGMSKSNRAGPPFVEDVRQLKALLNQLDPDNGSLR